MSEAATDAEALKKAEKERRRAEYAGKTFEKAPKQSQKEKNKEKKLAAQAGGERVKPGNKTETKSAGAATTTTPGGGGGVRRNSIDGNVNVKSTSNNLNAQQNSTGKQYIALFDHLDRKKPISTNNIFGHDRENVFIHPAIVRLGSQYKRGVVLDDDERVTALILAFYQVIEGYTTPPLTQLKRDLDKHIRNQVQHLVDCRQHSMGMGNVIKYIRHLITGLGEIFLIIF